MEIVFLLAGLAFVAVGFLIIASEARDRRGTEPVPARVIGFSTGRSNASNVSSFHTVAQYTRRGGGRYYVEGSLGSSVPLHGVGDTVTVLIDSKDPEKAVLESRISFALGGVLALMGLASIVVFGVTFRPGFYSTLAAAFIIGGLLLKIRKLWRKQPLSVEAWQEYKRTIFSTRVFTDETKDQIAWADPGRIGVALEGYRKANRFAVPVLLVLGAGLLMLSYHFYQKTADFLRIADRASGHVVSLRENDSDDNSTYSAVVEFRDDGGHNFRFVDSLSSSPPTYHIGQIVDVLYNRENHQEAQIDRGILNHWVAALFGSFGGIFSMCGLHAARKRFRISSARTPVGRPLL